jgi:IS605 OrfB family transposase
MKLVVQTQLLPDAAQAAKLRTVVERFNAAANHVAGIAFANQTANVYTLRKLCYAEVRARFGLSSQMAQLAIKTARDAYCRDRSIRPVFRNHAAIAYDQRTMRFKGIDRVSLLTLEGRVVVPFVLGQYQRAGMKLPRGQSDLVLRMDGKWFLIVTVDVPEAAPIPVTDFIGVDLGTVNIATDSDGAQMSGAKVEKARRKYGDERRTLQEAAAKRRQGGRRPRSIRRKLAKQRARESRYKKDVNHCTAKEYVETAKRTGRGIALEDLGGIRDRVTARGGDARNRLSGWSFFQFRSFVEYKALRAGVPVVFVDPAYTSQTCAGCGYCDRHNRKTQATFHYLHCGHRDNADRNAARNLRARAIVMWSQGDDYPADIIRWMPVAAPKCRKVGRSHTRNHLPVQAQAAGL